VKSTWTRYVALCLGIWLMASTQMFNELSTKMLTNDLISGLLITILAWRAIKATKPTVSWLLCLIGVWLQLAPLIFWAPSSASYLNDTLIGAAIIALSVVVAPLASEAETGAEIPKGWSYNPSSWAQRLPVAFFAFLSFLSARYMASYQLGYIDTIIDPLFDKGTFYVITSDISKSFPVSDAGLGSAAYLIEALMALKGGTRRWHTMPWMVALFGFLVVPVGLVSILLIMLQPLVVGHWCFWCLLTALFMLCMIALTVDEVAASIQFLRQEVKDGKPFWSTFWKGSVGDGMADMRTPALDESFRKVRSAMTWGVSIPYNLLLSTLVGIWLMFSPSYLQIAMSTSIADHILGALITAVSVISMAEVVRSFRLINILFGLFIAITPWVFEHSDLFFWDNFIAGIFIIALSLPKGKVNESYGKLNKFIV
jgi:hypothetical protein